MRAASYLCATAIVLGVSGTAMAQTPPPTPAAPAMAPTTDYGPTTSHYIVSGFLGSNWGSATSELTAEKRRSFEFGGQFGYLWHGFVGGEFAADFTPNFGVDSNLVDNPRVNSYMANAVGAYPFGDRGQYQPYASGGYGGIQMHFVDVLVAPGTTVSNDQLTGGGNFGGGIMLFAKKVGIRADVRYFRAMNNGGVTGDPADQVVQTLLSDLAYWRTNVGVAFRW